MNNNPQKPLLTKKEVQYLLNLKTTRVVDVLVGAGRLALVDLGKRTKRFRQSDLDALLVSVTSKATE
jgi:hypothetical protein